MSTEEIGQGEAQGLLLASWPSKAVLCQRAVKQGWHGSPLLPASAQAPPAEGLTVQQLIAERPEGVLRYLQRSGVRKLGEFCLEVS